MQSPQAAGPLIGNRLHLDHTFSWNPVTLAEVPLADLSFLYPLRADACQQMRTSAVETSRSADA